ncbi:glycosyltransferase family 4 protein [Patescibacteria group bacterium]|nr:glycosyltransferase family 4 protein [Patescibacteria group bacterium]
MQKVLIVSRSTVFHNKSGGMETQLETLVDGMKKDFDITILTTSKIPFQKTNLISRKNGVKYIFLKNTISGSNGYSLYENLFWQIPIKFKLNLLNTDFRKIASTYFESKLKGKFSKIISQSSACQNFNITSEKLFTIYHGTTQNEIKNRFRSVKNFKGIVRFIFLDLITLFYEYSFKNPIFFNKCFKIILVSETLKKDFCAQHKKFSSKCIVIQNGVDTKKFTLDTTKFKSKALNVVYYGRIDFEKGILNFLEVAKQIPEANFYVFGSGPNLQEFVNKSKELKNVFYKGAVTNTQVANELQNMHIFLFLTNRKEGMSMSILEAMSSGLVVITTVCDTKIGENNGHVYVENFSQAVEKIEYYKTNTNLLKQYSQNASKYILLNLSSTVMVEKYCNLLREN